jgi:hypothetical protein
MAVEAKKATTGWVALLTSALWLAGCADQPIATTGGATPSASVAPITLSAADQEELAGTHEVRLIGDGTEIEFTGSLTQAAVDDVRTLLDSHPGIKVIQLTSGGGMLAAAFGMASLVSRHDLVTYVPKYCGFACTIVFIAGRERYVAAGAELAFSQSHSSPTTTKSPIPINDVMEAWMRHQGVTDDFAKRAMATLPTTVWVPTPDELRQGHVVTAIGGDHPFAPPSFRLDWPDVADRILLNHPLYQALRKAEPDSYDALRDEYLRVMQSGVYGIESTPGDSLMTTALDRALPRAADQPVVDFFTALATVMEQADASGKCRIAAVGVAAEWKLEGAAATLAGLQMVRAATAVLETSVTQPQEPPSVASVHDAFVRLAVARAAKTGDGLPDIQAQSVMPCRDTAAFLRAILASPSADRSILLRGFNVEHRVSA